MQRRSACLYHPTQQITNFCRDPSCLMPLCPNCIGDHSFFHQQNNTKPQYASIYETLAQVQSQLYNSITALQHDKKRNSDLIKRISSLQQAVHQKCVSAKNMVMDMIEEAFQVLEKDLKNTLAKINEENGLYDKRRCDKMEENLAETLDELYKISDGLKSDKYLGHIIIFLKEKFQYSVDTHSKADQYLTMNEDYEPRMELRAEGKQAIVSGVSRLIKVEARRSEVQYLSRDKSLSKKAEMSRSKMGDPQQKKNKIDRSYTPSRATPHSQSTFTDSYFPSMTPTRSKAALHGDLYHDKNNYRPQASPLTTRVNNHTNYHQREQPDFKQEFEMLSRKVTQMRKENDILVSGSVRLK